MSNPFAQAIEGPNSLSSSGLAATSFRRRALFVLLSAYLVLKTWYLINSGLPQPADLLIVGAAVFVISLSAASAFFQRIPALGLFALWTVLVDGAWSVISADPAYMVNAAYYVFNLIICILVYQAFCSSPQRAAKFLNTAAVVSGVIQLAAVIAIGDRFRGTGTFQNPNQLAYWAVCALTIYFITKRGSISWKDALVVALFGALELRSVSRAGIGAMAVLLIVWVALNLRKQPKFFIATGAVIAAAILVAFAGQFGSSYIRKVDVIDKLEQRVSERRHVNEIHNRHYDRITDKIGYVALGAGEGDLSRFQSTGHVVEIHSTLANVLFSYGVIGFALFVASLITIFRTTPLSYSAYVIPPIFYGISHNGLRFSYFWIIIGLLISIGQLRRAGAQSGRPVGWPSLFDGRPVRSALNI